jgi:aqualysin 1
MGSARTALAQRNSVTLPVIVIFNDNASFESFQPNYHADDRAKSNPAAWNYLNRGVAGAVQYLESRHGFRAAHVYSAATKGFAARLTARQIEAMENDNMVSYVEPDGVATVSAQTLPWGVDRVDADLSSTHAGDGQGGVSNVHVYVIDTGVDTQHPDLNVVNHVNFTTTQNSDCHGHGTHVAGTIAAKDNSADVVGVSPGAPIIGVKVMDCGGSGYFSTIIKGVDWVTANAVRPAIANMSIGGSATQALDDAVIKSADSGVFYSIAAGNYGSNACNYSPARAGTHDGVTTTAATDSRDREASFSNYGSCVDIWAPGVSILSTRLGGGTTTMSGTSMAAPHVGGIGALYLSSVVGATPAQVEAAVKSSAVLMPVGKGNKLSGASKDGRQIQLVNGRTY